MDIYVRFFLSLLNARSPCRDCNSAIIPRLRTTYRTNLFASSYFCRTSGPHAGPILQQISCKTAAQGQAQDQFRSKLVFLPCKTAAQGQAQDQFRSKLVFLPHLRSTVRTKDHREDKFPPASSAQNKREPRSIPRLPYCVLCNVSGRYAVTCILASLRASLAYDLLTHPA